MIAIKKTTRVRLEIEFEVLMGELRHLEDDLARMSLSQFIQVWSPEMKESRMMLRLIDLKEKKDER